MKDINFEIRIPRFEFSNHRKFQFRLVLSLLAIAGAFVAKQYLDFSFVGTLILIYFFLSVVWNLTSRISASFALFFLALTPIMLFFKNEDLAETFAIYAYYFLVITVVSEILSLRKENETTSEQID